MPSEQSMPHFSVICSAHLSSLSQLFLVAPWGLCCSSWWLLGKEYVIFWFFSDCLCALDSVAFLDQSWWPRSRMLPWNGPVLPLCCAWVVPSLGLRWLTIAVLQMGIFLWGRVRKTHKKHTCFSYLWDAGRHRCRVVVEGILRTLEYWPKSSALTKCMPLIKSAPAVSLRRSIACRLLPKASFRCPVSGTSSAQQQLWVFTN